MKLFIHLLLITSLGFSINTTVHAAVQVSKVALMAKDGFKLKADYFAGQSHKPGVLMLHQCNAERSMYEQLGKKLAAQGIHALSLDFRMYGESVTEHVNLETISATEPDRTKRRALFNQHRKYWPADVIVALHYLQEKMASNAAIGVIGASCGGGQAIQLATTKQVNALMFFSSGMDEETLSRYQTLSATPTFIIAAEGDTYTFNSSQKLFAQSNHPQNRLINYKGEGHGHPLFKQDPSLADNMVAWMQQQLTSKQ